MTRKDLPRIYYRDFEIHPFQDKEEDKTTYGAKIHYYTWTSTRESKGELVVEAIDRVDELAQAIENKYVLAKIAKVLEEYDMDLHDFLWDIKAQIDCAGAIHINLKKESESDSSDSS